MRRRHKPAGQNAFYLTELISARTKIPLANEQNWTGIQTRPNKKRRTFLPARTGTETARPIRTAASSRLSSAKATMPGVCRCI